LRDTSNVQCVKKCTNVVSRLKFLTSSLFEENLKEIRINQENLYYREMS